jgi:hypothetical protein
MRGMCLEGSRKIGIEDLQPLRDLGVGWISQTPFGFGRGLDSPAIVLAGERVLWGETDSGLVRTAMMARSLGMHTLLKPHVWVRHGAWSGDIAMRNEADWQAWFVSYETWILHYARLAEEHGFEVLAVGTELGRTTSRSLDWRRIIARVRAVYHGQLTYCANWQDEVERIDFWDALDFVGVQAYYPLAANDSRPQQADLCSAWAPIASRLQDLAARTRKPIVFTEVGYKSVADGLREPWRWDADGAQDLELQREAFAALFEVFWSQPWFGGTFIWKWHPRLEGRIGRIDCDFTPQGKPALEVIRAVYSAPSR